APKAFNAYSGTFSTDGRRAIFLGQYNGATMSGGVYEYRDNLYTQQDITDVSIPNFDQPPYNADSQTTLNAGAFRPGCDEGLIVGGKNTFSGQTALVIKFSVTNGTHCP